MSISKLQRTIFLFGQFLAGAQWFWRRATRIAFAAIPTQCLWCNMRISGAHALQHVHEMQNLNGLAFDQDVTLSAPALAGDAQQQPFQPRACLDWLELLPKHLALIQRLLGSYWASTHKAHTSLSDCLAACMVCWPCRGGFLYSPSILIVVRQQQSVVLALTSCLFNISVLPLIFGRSLLP